MVGTVTRSPLPAISRGFTLIEVMIVVALLGIIAAMVGPAFVPLIRDQELKVSAEQVAAFVHGARMRAIADRRCTRVIISSNQNPVVLVGQVLNTFDCGDSVDAAQHPSSPLRPIDPGAGSHWIEFARTTIDRGHVRVDWDVVPSETAPHPDPNDTEDEARYRATGRLYSRDTNLTDDDGVLRITSTASNHTFHLLLEAHGPICMMPRDQTPPGTGNNRSCP